MADAAASTGRVPRGWYDDTTARARWRYWDGSAWTPWIASGTTPDVDSGGAPDAAPPVPASRARGPHPRDVEPDPGVRLPPYHLGTQPLTPVRDSVFAGWLIATLIGGVIAVIGVGVNASAPPFSDGSESSGAFLVGPMLIVIGLLVLGVGAVVAVAVATQDRNDRRRRPR